MFGPADYAKAKGIASAGEGPKAENTTQPDPQQLAATLQKTTEQLAKTQQQMKDQNDKTMRMMEENARQQQILRTELEKRIAPSVQQQQPPAGDTSWQSLLGINVEEQVAFNPAQPQQQQATAGKIYSEEEMRAFYAKIRNEERQAEFEAAQKRQQEIVQLRERLGQEAPDITGDPVAQTIFKNTLDGIHQLRPDLSLTQAYEMAVQQTRGIAQETGRQWTPPGKKAPPATPPQNAYIPPAGGSIPQRQIGNNDPLMKHMEQRSPQETLESRKGEIKDLRKAHLAKFGRA